MNVTAGARTTLAHPPEQVVPPRTGRLLDVDYATFRANYNRRPFLFTHRLAEHPLMQFDSLVALANRLPSDQVRYCRGKTSLETNFDKALTDRRHRLSVQELLDDMQHSDAYVLLFQTNTDPEYDQLFDEALVDLKPLLDPIDPHINWRAASIFIASPEAITPYHMDREMNFLCQVRGTKDVQLWDQNDRSIMSQEAIERVYACPTEPKPGYKPEYAAKAMHFTLSPGTGVNQPLMAPHAVTNGNEVSVAIAFTYRTRGSQRQALVHAFNHRLRRLGVNPREYNRSPWLDSAKSRLMGAYLQARSLELG